MRYVELTEMDDSKIYVNLDNVRILQRRTVNKADVTEIYFNAPPSYWRVKETPEEILTKIKIIGG